jgi:hypothetical protein
MRRALLAVLGFALGVTLCAGAIGARLDADLGVQHRMFHGATAHVVGDPSAVVPWESVP